ncbi:GNAT family N-acetyltransferase [Humibacter sp. BT305]|nr:GNAT family N-acetyltransferase [Humibacter sp. BT305]
MRIREGEVTGPDESRLLADYFAYRAEAFPQRGAYVVTGPKPADYAPGHGVFLVVEDDEGTAVGCAGLRMLDTASEDGPRAEVKHVWLSPAARGHGWAHDLMAELERRAAGLGAVELVLDTHHTLDGAARLYAREGFCEIAAYNDNPNATRWYGKRIGPAQ